MYKNKYLSLHTFALLFLLINSVCSNINAAQQPQTDGPHAQPTAKPGAHQPADPAAPITTADEDDNAKTEALNQDIIALKDQNRTIAEELEAEKKARATAQAALNALKANPQTVIQHSDWASCPDRIAEAYAENLKTQGELNKRKLGWGGTWDNVSERLVYPIAKDVISFTFNEWRTNETLKPYGYNIGSGWYKTKLEEANDTATKKKQESDKLLIEASKLDIDIKKQQKENGEIDKKYKDDLNDAQLLNTYINSFATMCANNKKKGEFPECDRMFDMAATIQAEDLAVLLRRRMAKKETPSKAENSSKPEAKS